MKQMKFYESFVNDLEGSLKYQRRGSKMGDIFVYRFGSQDGSGDEFDILVEVIKTEPPLVKVLYYKGLGDKEFRECDDFFRRKTKLTEKNTLIRADVSALIKSCRELKEDEKKQVALLLDAKKFGI